MPPETTSSTDQTASATATRYPPTTATVVPARRSSKTFQTAARSTRPPSIGSAGSRLNTATTALDRASRMSTSQLTVLTVTPRTASQNTPASSALTAGPAAAMTASSRGVFGALVSSETPLSR